MNRRKEMDAEAEMIASEKETGREWEKYKENIRPLKRGRNISLLNHSLRSHSLPLHHTRRSLIQAIDHYIGPDPLLPWLQCIKWVEEAFPAGGEWSGLVVIYEQCVRSFWNSPLYKQDLRFLKVWLEYAQNCHDAQLIYTFLEANEIGNSHSDFYIAYGLHLESNSNTKLAHHIFNLGISRNAKPIEKLRDAYKKFFIRSMKTPILVEDQDSQHTHSPPRTFGTLIPAPENARPQTSYLSTNIMKPQTRGQIQNAPFSIYKDKKMDKIPASKPESTRTDVNAWHTLGTRAERNKENNAIPSKWTTYKVPQRPLPRAAGATAASARIQVFVDEECAEMDKQPQKHGGSNKGLSLQARQGSGLEMKRETELLRENPLRNFPLHSLPR